METFILLNKKTYRRFVKIYLPKSNVKNAYFAKHVQFTTDGLIDPKNRSTAGRTKNAEYKTSVQDEIDALMSSDGYGKEYTLKRDPEGKLKKPSRNLSNDDQRKASLRGLYKEMGIEFDDSKTYEFLLAEYSGYIKALTGSKGTQGNSSPAQIPVSITNVSQNIEDMKNAARAKYFDLFAEEIPSVVYNDLTFLDGIMVPGFDAKSYIENALKQEPEDKGTEVDVESETPESLGKKYLEKYGVLPPAPYKNNIGWLKNKLTQEVK